MKKMFFALGLLLILGTEVVSAKKIKNASLEDVVTVTPGAVMFKVEDVEIADEYLPSKYGAELGDRKSVV